MAQCTVSPAGGDIGAIATFVEGRIPTSSDDIVLPAGAGPLVISSDPANPRVCRSYVEQPGYAGTVTHTASLFIGDAGGGAFTVSGTSTHTGTATIFLQSSSTNGGAGWAVTTNGNTTLPSITFNNVNGHWSHQDAFNNQPSGGLYTIAAGRVDTNNFNATVGRCLGGSSASLAVTFNVGTSHVTLQGSGLDWNWGRGSNTTVNAALATITISTTNSQFAHGSTDSAGLVANFGTLIFGGTGTVNFSLGTTTPTFGNITRTGGATLTESLSLSVPAGSSLVVTGTLTLTGNARSQRALLTTFGANVQVSVVVNGAVVASNIDVLNIAASGTASWNLSAITGGAADLGNNTGITFTPGRTLYGVAAGLFSSSATWSLSSGGAAGEACPIAQDTVRLDGNSGAGTYTSDLLRPAAAFDCTGFTGTFTMANLTAFYGPTALSPTMTITGAFNFSLTGKGGSYTLTSAGKTLPNASTVGGTSSSTWTLADAASLTAAISITSGTFVTNNFTITALQLSSGGTIARTLSLGTSAISVSTAIGVTFSTNTGLVFAPNSATITFTASSPSINTGSNAAQGVDMMGTNLVFAGSGTFSITGPTNGAGSSFGSITRVGTAVKTDQLSLGVAVTLTGTLTVTGNSLINRVKIQSSTLGTQRTITAAAVSLTNVNISDIAGAGNGGNAWTGTSLGDCLGNSGITFDPSVTRYAKAAGNFSATATWAATSGGAAGASVPLPQDDVRMDSTAGAGTYTVDMPHAGRNLDCTGFTRTLAAGTANFYGSVTLATGMTVSGTATITFAGRGSQTFTTAGKTITFTLTISGPGGTYTLQDAFTSNRSSAAAVQVSSGTLATNNYTLSLSATVGAFSLAGGTLNAGTSLLTFAVTGATLWNYSAGTFIGPSSTITFTGSTATAGTFEGGSQSFGTVNFTGTGTRVITLTGSNTFVNLNVSGAAKTLRITAATMQTVTGTADLHGTAGNLVTLDSSTAGSPGRLVLAPGATLTANYLSIKDNHVQAAGVPVATNSVNVSGNRGWAFGAATGLLKNIGDVAKPVKDFDGSIWVYTPVKLWDGAAWVAA